MVEGVKEARQVGFLTMIEKCAVLEGEGSCIMQLRELGTETGPN